MPKGSNHIFVSSTYRDLEAYRKAVINSLQTMGTSYYAMEFFSATPKTPKQECLDTVACSDIFIIIVGMRYGSVDPDTDKSYMHLEYEKALETGSTILAFLIDEQKQPVLPINVDQGTAAEKLRDFKKMIQS